MSYNEWDSSSVDSVPVEFNVWNIRSEEEANVEIAQRLAIIKKQHEEVLEIAERFDIRVQYELESELICGHNRTPEINWNPSSQNCY